MSNSKFLVGQTVIVKERTHTGTTSDMRSRAVRIEGNLPTGRYQGRFLANPVMGRELIPIDGDDIERALTDREAEVI